MSILFFTNKEYQVCMHTALRIIKVEKGEVTAYKFLSYRLYTSIENMPCMSMWKHIFLCIINKQYKHNTADSGTVQPRSESIPIFTG